ncbi:hypothetical protein DPMN_145175 [Dreissena polymorpha]|uniref:Uncharacterized protein n=1 Tax=Dreissena polymorpha TaxID=45954 RepID=A0A9D4F5G8_DREPO|nr:hypothetical protein DPMN_145175 [Dreissena polymorpha]
MIEDQQINVTSRVLTRKNAPPPGSHVFQPTDIIFEHFHDIIGLNLLTNKCDLSMKNAPPLGSHTNLLTKFHEDWTINVASRVLARKNAPRLGSHVFQANTNLLTKFHEDWTINVASRVLTSLTRELSFFNIRLFTCFHYIHIEKTAPPNGDHVFSPIWTMFELVRDINETNVLTKFHDDWAKIVTSRVFTRKTAPPPGGHVFQRTGTILKLNQHII